jgi:large subunit ribosomal protein L9
MKVILNKDLATLGEEGDVKDVAKGYARNYLFPRGIALPYTEHTIKLFEARKDEIEARKAEKRKDASGIKEKLEALALVITMPAGANGKLYGAVSAQTVMEELLKQGFQVERKRIELPGNTIKSVGKFKVVVKLYENESAELGITIEGQQIKTETKAPVSRDRRRGAGKTASSEGEERTAENEASPPAAPETAPQDREEETAKEGDAAAVPEVPVSPEPENPAEESPAGETAPE